MPASTIRKAFPDSSMLWGPTDDNFTGIYGGGPRVYDILITPGYIIDWRITICAELPTWSVTYGAIVNDPAFWHNNKWMTYLGCMGGKADDTQRGVAGMKRSPDRFHRGIFC